MGKMKAEFMGLFGEASKQYQESSQKLSQAFMEGMKEAGGNPQMPSGK